MKLKYRINTILKYNNELEKSPYYVGIEAIILGNKCLCISNNKNVFVFNKIYRLIQTIDLSTRYFFKKNMTPILNYPNLFALRDYLQDEFYVHIYEVQLGKKKQKVILKRRIKNPKKYIKKKTFYLFIILCRYIIFF